MMMMMRKTMQEKREKRMKRKRNLQKVGVLCKEGGVRSNVERNWGRKCRAEKLRTRKRKREIRKKRMLRRRRIKGVRRGEYRGRSEEEIM